LNSAEVVFFNIYQLEWEKMRDNDRLLFIASTEEKGDVFTFVGLSVSQQDYSELCGPILMKFCG